jgi:hypothetical protein
MIRSALATAIYMVATLIAIPALAFSFVAETLMDLADDMEGDA